MQGELGVRETNLARRVTQNLLDLGAEERKLAREAYAMLGKELAKAKVADVARAGRQLVGVGKRLGLLGQEMVIQAKTVEGKDFDLAKLKGKVVLVGYWATWNQQCVGDMINAKRL